LAGDSGLAGIGGNDAIGLRETANLAVRGGNLPPIQTHGNVAALGESVVRSAVGLVARQNGPVARSSLNLAALFRLGSFCQPKIIFSE
jgi:hypothetical protein